MMTSTIMNLKLYCFHILRPRDYLVTYPVGALNSIIDEHLKNVLKEHSANEGRLLHGKNRKKSNSFCLICNICLIRLNMSHTYLKNPVKMSDFKIS